MKSLPLASVVFLFLAVPCLAKSPVGSDSKSGIGISPGEVSATPEMWFYEQSLRQYQDPKTAVRQKAEFRAAERARRLAALRWFGFSNSRPQAVGDPFHGEYAPHWASSDGYRPFRWAGPQAPAITVVTPSRSAARSD